MLFLNQAILKSRYHSAQYELSGFLFCSLSINDFTLKEQINCFMNLGIKMLFADVICPRGWIQATVASLLKGVEVEQE